MFMAVLIISLPIIFAEEYSRQYDANGNLIYDQQDDIYREYNELNQLVKTRQNNATGIILQEYTFDAIKERIFIKDEFYNNGSLKSSTYYFDDDYIVIQNSSGTYNRTSIYQDGVLVGYEDFDGKKRYVLPDHKGNVHLVLNESGDIIEENLFSPFAEPLAGVKENKFSYEAKEYDPLTKDYDFHFRKFSVNGPPILNQPDTLISNVYDPQLLNRYSFERSNPYKYEDPDGHIFWVPFVIGAAAGLIHGGYHYYKTGDVKGAVMHGSITAAVTTASILAPVTAAGGTLLRGASYVGTRLFVTGATGSLAHSAVEGQDFTSAQPYVNALLGGTLNAIGTPLLHRLGVPGLTNYKPGQYFPSNSFSPVMFNEFVSTAISTGAIDVSSAAILSQANRYFSYFSQQANAASGNSGSSGSGGGGGGGGCRCGPWGDLREEAEKAKPGETAGDIIRRWREKQS